MGEALRGEAGQQALDDALVEMQLHDVVGDAAGVLKDDRPDGGSATPLGDRQVGTAWWAQ